ncbi:MAG: hypothetical protein ACK4HV_04540, partial [Parachlamydiaceae bacterium]
PHRIEGIDLLPDVRGLTKNDLYELLRRAFAAYYPLRFPNLRAIPAFKITETHAKTVAIGPYRMEGSEIAIKAQNRTFLFESSKDFSIIKAETPLLPYPKEGLAFILDLLQLAGKEIEVTEVKDKQYLSWDSLSPITNETLWSVECYSIKFNFEDNLYHFVFDRKLRFFKNGINNELHYKKPFLDPITEKKCIDMASLILNLNASDIKITHIAPTTHLPDIGYRVEFNDGALKLFYPCLPNETRLQIDKFHIETDPTPAPAL